MEQIVILSCGVIFILLCCYWLVTFILNIRQEFKLEKENDLLVKDIEYFKEKCYDGLYRISAQQISL